MSKALESSTSKDVEKLSQLLFIKIKPLCIELSQETTASDFQKNRILSLVISIKNCLQSHLKENQGEFPMYRLSESIADYVFYPFSNLLRLPELDDSIVQHLLYVLGFLMQYSWSFNVKFELVDQLFPLIIFLSAGDLKTKPSLISTKSSDFKDSAGYALSVITSLVDHDYFGDSDQAKRLLFLSNTISVLLDIIATTSPDSQEGVKIITNSFETIIRLTSNLSPSKQSQILPGIVSSVANFVSKNPNINHQIIIRILNLLSNMISSSFNDRELHTKLDMVEVNDLKNINIQWNQDRDSRINDSDISISITESDHRTSSWINATSKQLKLALIPIFKSILLDSRNRHRWKMNITLYESILRLITKMLKSCFVTLFADFASLFIDIFSILTFITSHDDNKEDLAKAYSLSNSMCSSIESTDGVDSELVLFNLVQSKLSDLINSKLPSLLFSTDEDKISMNILAIQFHFVLLVDLSKKVPTNSEVVHTLKMECLKLLHQYLIQGYEREHSNEPTSTINSDKISTHGESHTSKLDNIELPGYINTGNIVKQQHTKKVSTKSYIHNLQLIASKWNESDISTGSNETLVGVSSRFIEVKVKQLVNFLSSLKVENTDMLQDLEELIEMNNSEDELLNSGISLWMASNYLRGNNYQTTDNFDPEEYLILEDGEDNGLEQLDNELEHSYLILAKVEDLISEIVEKPLLQLNESSIIAFSAALDAVDAVVGRINKVQFQNDFLMDYLLSLFQALTYNDYPQIQLQAQSTLRTILATYYDNSMKSLIMDNLDYLIDSISLQMSVAGSLTPTLPGILLIIVKVSGIQLLESNQLNDILTEMFVILDAYHGYNNIVESFFIVFESLIEQVGNHHSTSLAIENRNLFKGSMYKPWGITDKEALLNLISSADRVIDPFEGYNSNTEYFTRPKDAPFSENLPDSDDEEEEEEVGTNEEQEPPWESNISKHTYFILQQIFNYGFSLLSQPSYSLKSQIIKTLRQIFPLLCTNFKLVLPVVTSNWPLITTLICGSENLAINIPTKPYTATEDTSLVIQSLEFATEILTQDTIQKEFFFGRKFQETWDFLSNHSGLIPKELQHSEKADEKQIAIISKSLSSLRVNKRLKVSLVKFLITGVQNYERSVPDLTRFQIIKLCHHLQIPENIYLSRDTRSIIEVLQIRSINA